MNTKTFKEVARVFIEQWSSERNAEGKPVHSASGVYSTCLRLECHLIPFFGEMLFHEIKPRDVLRYQSERLEHVRGTTVNCELTVLSSMFSHIFKWQALELIEPFAVPASNPCHFIERAPLVKRDRVLNQTELSRLKQACLILKDQSLWEIIEMSLKTMLRKKDLKSLTASSDVSIVQAKTQKPVHLPVEAKKLNFTNFRKRLEAAKIQAGLKFQFRDLRRSSATMLMAANHSNALISKYLGHSSVKTTDIYLANNAEYLKPLTNELTGMVAAL